MGADSCTLEMRGSTPKDHCALHECISSKADGKSFLKTGEDAFGSRETLLLATLAAEGVPQVGELVRSLGAREPDERIVSTLAASAQAEESPLVRGEMIRVLARGGDRFSAVRETFQCMLDTETDPQNLELFHRFLSRTSSGP